MIFLGTSRCGLPLRQTGKMPKPRTGARTQSSAPAASEQQRIEVNRDNGRDGTGRGRDDRPDNRDAGKGRAGDTGAYSSRSRDERAGRGSGERTPRRERGYGRDKEGRRDRPFRANERDDRRRDAGRDSRAYGERERDRDRPPARRGGFGGRYGVRNRDDREERPFRDRRDQREDRPARSFRDRPERRPSRDRGGRTFGDRPRPFSRDNRTGGDGRGSRSTRREKLPELAADIRPDELDREAREELRSLPNDLADLVAKHLVAVVRALSVDDPERAYEHAKVARRFATRVGVVREVSGIAAYRAGQYAEALKELRTARRLTGIDDYLPMMADCERGLGRPERALDLIRSPEAERLDRAGRIELAIVESGARRDLGQYDAAVVTLQRVPELRDPEPKPWSARLAFAYADALADAGQEKAAIDWFARAMAFDEDEETAAAERYAELTGGTIEDLEEDYAPDHAGEIDDVKELDDVKDLDDRDTGDRGTP